jgi:hypothetical protein
MFRCFGNGLGKRLCAGLVIFESRLGFFIDQKFCASISDSFFAFRRIETECWILLLPSVKIFAAGQGLHLGGWGRCSVKWRWEMGNPPNLNSPLVDTSFSIEGQMTLNGIIFFQTILNFRKLEALESRSSKG